ncbi:MAG: hypothetical protein AAF363_11495 [Bacteroidota bacterium]
MKILQTILMFIFLIATGIISGGYISSLFIEEGSGFTGGAIIFWGILFGSLAGLLIAILIKAKANPKKIVKLNITLAIALLIFFFFFIRHAKSNEPGSSDIFFVQNLQKNVGIGLATPNFYEKRVIYFYNPNLQKSVGAHSPIDSLTFKRTELGTEISYAPPWFFPLHMKMDYDILKLKVVSMTSDWIQVEVNKATGRTVWMDRFDVSLSSWETFLLEVHSVEFLDASQEIKVKPLDHSSKVTIEGAFMRPIEVKSEWLKVELLDSEYKAVGEGWIKWRKGSQLLISYDLLS